MSLGRLKPWILLPMATALGLVLVVVLIAIHRARQQGIEVQTAERARLVQELLDQQLADETRALTEALLLLRDPALSRALAERDREALSRSADPLFTRLCGVQWHAPSGFRSVGRLNVASATPARPSGAKTIHAERYSLDSAVDCCVHQASLR